jgi:hypothetical protein
VYLHISSTSDCYPPSALYSTRVSRTRISPVNHDYLRHVTASLPRTSWYRNATAANSSGRRRPSHCMAEPCHRSTARHVTTARTCRYGNKRWSTTGAGSGFTGHLPVVSALGSLPSSFPPSGGVYVRAEADACRATRYYNTVGSKEGQHPTSTSRRRRHRWLT